MIKLSAGLIVILTVLLAGCRDSMEKVPPKIMPGQDVCDNCFMLINEIKYAAAVTLNNGEEKRFDDISCMLSFIQDNRQKIRYYWVFDFLSGTSLQAEKAYYVRSKKEITPMGGGIIAFGVGDRAQEFASNENTAAINFMDLINNND